MIEDLSNASFRAVMDHIHTHFVDFLRLPHYKQANLAEKALTELVKQNMFVWSETGCCMQFPNIIKIK